MQNRNGIGIMSGTSLDGVDIAFCKFGFNPTDFSIDAAHTFPFPCGLKGDLQNIELLSGLELHQLDLELGRFFGELVSRFIKVNQLEKVDFVASHGHTVFHQPDEGIALQIGHPGVIATSCGIQTIGDFRISDVMLGGQGAPLAPIVDRNLFSSYRYRINLGGFANLSFEVGQKTIGFDICPVNMALNHEAEKLGLSMDENGNIARGGVCDESLLEALNAIPYYQKSPPKTLGREWYTSVFKAVLEQYPLTGKNVLRTLTEHIAIQIASQLKTGRALLTGGGACNRFLVERITDLTSCEIILPSPTIIHFKESLLIAYLGLLRLQEKPNTLHSVTGAEKSHSSGCIYLP